MHQDVRPVVQALGHRIGRLADAERFEDAAVHRDRLAAFVRASARLQRLAALTRCAEVVAARRVDDGGWEVVVVRRGRLVGTGVAAPGSDPWAVVGSVRAAAEDVTPGPGPLPAASAEESECILRWLEQPGIRLVDIDGEWASPLHGAGGVRSWANAADEVGEGAWLRRRPDLRTVHQPAAAVSRIAG
jgi:DNA polymerase-3 subunit epsilon